MATTSESRRKAHFARWVDDTQRANDVLKEEKAKIAAKVKEKGVENGIKRIESDMKEMGLTLDRRTFGGVPRPWKQ